MLSRLHFERSEAAPTVAPDRADVACFVGRVPRRPGARLPPAQRDALRAQGWVDGPWDPGEEALESLLHLPAVLDSWEAFDALFAWDTRRIRVGAEARCASYLGAAVRSFFAHGGRRAVVVRTGDPWPYLDGEDRAAAREARLDGLVPGWRPGGHPFDPTDPRTWRGVEHLYGLAEVSHVCLPDLADACSLQAPPLEAASPPPPAPEGFVACSADEPAAPGDRALRSVAAPRLDAAGYGDWTAAVRALREFLARHRRDVLALAALPLPGEDAAPGGGGPHPRSDPGGFLAGAGVLAPDRAEPGDTAASALVQLVWPWVRTTRSDDLPERLEPGDGLLAGVLADNALTRGTYRSAAGTRLPLVVAPEPTPDLGLGPDSPAARLAERVCLVGPEPDGIRLLSDVTSSPDPAWRAGPVSRLMAVLLRAALRTGETQLFDANGPALWTRVRRDLEELLEGFFRAGALRASGRDPAYEVRCDRSTMSQNDLDHGRVRVEITVQPAAPVERITVSLELGSGGSSARLPEVA